MARPCSGHDDTSDDEFPDVQSLAHQPRRPTRLKVPDTPLGRELRPDPKSATKTPALRRRKLGGPAGNTLLQPLGGQGPTLGGNSLGDLEGNERKGKLRVQLRARKQRPAAKMISPERDESEEEKIPGSGSSDKEEVTFVEEASVDDSSEFHDPTEDSEDDESSIGDVFALSPPGPSSTRTQRIVPSLAKAKSHPAKTRLPSSPRKNTVQVPKLAPPKDSQPPDIHSARTRRDQKGASAIGRQPAETRGAPSYSLSEAISNMHLDDESEPETVRQRNKETGQPVTAPPPPLTPPKPRTVALVSPKKLPRIPTTPHRPSTDLFWSQEFVDDWNDEYSPRKQLFPDTTKSPDKASPRKREQQMGGKPVSAREAKRLFEKAKHEIADTFLKELDAAITGGQLAEMAASTGGVKITWTNKLNTTAGRANWKRETLRKAPAADGSSGGGEEPVRYRHHASIELAEKVIDDEHRLLNVVAHEFCHLANFMVSGVRGNPHGREFKEWAARCGRAFGDRGIEVTTRHSYAIDFKYAWECGSCGTEYKRHSKSIDPAHQLCGICKGKLVQTKPAPRAATKATEYQAFMKEHMKRLRTENPKSPQKEIMRLVADQWARHQAVKSSAGGKELKVPDTVVALNELTLEG